MPFLDVATGSTLGVLLGMRHALEPDHLAAVSTLMSESRSPRRAAMLGLSWGFGHTIALVAVGAVLVVLRAELPERVADLFEFFVALMLIGLGIRAVVLAVRQGPSGPRAEHHHGPVTHTHHGVLDHVHVGTFTIARRPLLIGMVHGLAGSGALTALVLASLPTIATRIVYMVLFGLGSSLGMAMLSGLLGWPLARLGTQSLAFRALSIVVGCLSVGLGVFWGAPLLPRLLQ